MGGMDRREFLRQAGRAAVGASLLPALGCGSDSSGGGDEPEPEAQSPSNPNLLVVLPDQFRRQAIGALGEDPVFTPNLDRFCSESVVFTQAISNSPVCSPYRAMLLTGKWPSRTGVWTNPQLGEAYSDVYLKAGETCLTDILSQAGYNVGYIGKWHLDRLTADPTSPEGWGGYTPPERRHGCTFWHAYNSHNQLLRPYYWTTDARPADWLRVNRWSPTHEADVAIEFIRNHQRTAGRTGRPFALFVAMNPPHPPFYEVPAEYLEPYRERSVEQLLNRPNVRHDLTSEATTQAREQVRNYFAAVTGVDEQFGRILDCLRREGADRDTIVVFTSDHGESLGSHDRLGKYYWHEEAMGIPFVVRWPGALAPRRDDLLLSVPDVMPTILSLLGFGDRIPSDVQGADYSHLMRTGEGERPESALYVHWYAGHPHPVRSGVRTDRYTLAIQRGDDAAAVRSVILHDNEQDPFQLRNFASEQPGVVSELTEEANRWLRSAWGPDASA